MNHVLRRSQAGTVRGGGGRGAVFLAVAFLMALAAGGAGSGAGDIPPQQPVAGQQKPTFRAVVSLVLVDVSVTDAEGRFVSTLTKDDFTVIEDGRPQQVATFDLKDLPVPEAEPAPAPVPWLAPDVRSNTRDVTGRVYVIVLDDVHTSAERAIEMTRVATRFIDRYVAPGDMAAVVLTSGQRTRSQEFTSNRDLLIGAVQKFQGLVPVAGSGEALPGGESRAGNNANVEGGSSGASAPSALPGYRVRSALSTLTAVVSALAHVQDRRKACVYFGPGFDMLDHGTRIMVEAQDFAAAANRANVSFYTVDPWGLASLAGVVTAVAPGSARDDNLGAAYSALDRAQEGLRWLAVETGGFATTGTNNFGPPFARIRRENSSYYLLGYYPTGEQRAGTSHHIDVKVRRPGVSVHARRGYVVPKGPATATVIKAKNVPPVLLPALDSPLPNAGIRLSVAAAAFRNGDGPAQASVVMELDGQDLDLGGHGGLEVAVIAVDHLGTIRGHDARHVDLALDAAALDRVREYGLRVHTRVPLPDGACALRLAVADSATPRVGSLWLDLDVPDDRAMIAMSGLLVTADRARAVPTVNENAGMTRDLPAPPTTRRVFGPDETLTWLAEIYAGRRAGDPTLTTTITGADGEEVLRRTVPWSSRAQGVSTWRMADRAPLAGYHPGTYVLHLEASAGGSTAFRAVPFEVRAPVP